jgi:hypothetical protein
MLKGFTKSYTDETLSCAEKLPLWQSAHKSAKLCEKHSLENLFDLTLLI